MDTFIDIVRVKRDTDSEGFKKDTEEILASVRAYREGRHGSEKWANRAAFSEATDLFRFSLHPQCKDHHSDGDPLRRREIQHYFRGGREGTGNVFGGAGKGGDRQWPK